MLFSMSCVMMFTHAYMGARSERTYLIRNHSKLDWHHKLLINDIVIQ